ncbi:MAG: hypothetical protein II723_07495 [Oscillospiraceae bacterium]|nr:hypothetical protein [Oscillospiraceae bacterium]
MCSGRQIRKKMIAEQTAVLPGESVAGYLLVFLVTVMLWALGVIQIDYPELFLITGIGGTILFVLHKLHLFNLVNPDADASYIWFYGRVDDLVLGSNKSGILYRSLSVNGYEIPIQKLPPSVSCTELYIFTKSSEWLLNTDVIVVQNAVQKIASDGVYMPNYLIFPAKKNKVFRNDIVIADEPN